MRAPRYQRRACEVCGELYQPTGPRGSRCRNHLVSARERARRWYAANPEKAREKSSRRRAANPARRRLEQRSAANRRYSEAALEAARSAGRIIQEGGAIPCRQLAPAAGPQESKAESPPKRWTARQ